jgi:uncharacterized protein
MRVNIAEIKEAGLDRAWEVTRDQLDEMVKGDPAGYRAQGPTRVAARLDLLERRVRLRARARAELNCPCGRCLAPMVLQVPVDFDLTLVPAQERTAPAREEHQDREQAPTSASFEPEDVDEETYSGKVIDLDPILREQILLALPGYPVCAEGCKGLCPVCGQNLNDRDCGCDRRVPDPRWAGLMNVKLK